AMIASKAAALQPRYSCILHLFVWNCMSVSHIRRSGPLMGRLQVRHVRRLIRRNRRDYGNVMGVNSLEIIADKGAPLYNSPTAKPYGPRFGWEGRRFPELRGSVMHVKRIAQALCALALGIGCIFGQTTTGTLLGTVADPTDAAVPGAQVELTNIATG